MLLKESMIFLREQKCNFLKTKLLKLVQQQKLSIVKLKKKKIKPSQPILLKTNNLTL